ncbi:MAG: preprotein translocase subunit SecG [Patescibacteria group bacterium]
MYFSIIQIIVAVALIILILLQERSTGLSSVFGGSEEGSYFVRRGMERLIFLATIVLAVILVGLSLTSLLIK